MPLPDVWEGVSGNTTYAKPILSPAEVCKALRTPVPPPHDARPCATPRGPGHSQRAWQQSDLRVAL
eukprot:915205-Pleurochrysis_carterae.AAC.1